MKSWGENKRAEVKSVQATGKRANINGTEEVASNRGSRDRVRMRHTPNEKRQSKTERRLPLHLYISLEPINLWNWILAMKERERERGSSATSGNHNEGCSSMEKRSEEENDETLLSLYDICPLNRISSAEQNSEEWYRVKGRKREAGRENTTGKKQGELKGIEGIEWAWMTVKRKRVTGWAEHFPLVIVSPVVAQKRKTWVMLLRSTSLSRFMFWRG